VCGVGVGAVVWRGCGVEGVWRVNGGVCVCVCVYTRRDGGRCESVSKRGSVRGEWWNGCGVGGGWCAL